MAEPLDSAMNELDVLRLENDTLRRKLVSLDDKVRCIEEHSIQRRDKVEEAAWLGQEASVEVQQLSEILQRLYEAKEDIVNSDRSKARLEEDVQLLKDLLERARRERRDYRGTINRLEKGLAAAEAKITELKNEIGLQRRSFQLVLRQDRDAYEARTEAAEIRAERRAEELERVMEWVEKANSRYADALAKVSAQAEDIGAANLGDLEGFALDMSTEIERLRKGVTSALQTQESRVPRRLKKAKDTGSSSLKSEMVTD